MFYFYSVVEFASKHDMNNAIRKLDDTELFGKRVKLICVSYHVTVFDFANISKFRKLLLKMVT